MRQEKASDYMYRHKITDKMTAWKNSTGKTETLCQFCKGKRHVFSCRESTDAVFDGVCNIDSYDEDDGFSIHADEEEIESPDSFAAFYLLLLKHLKKEFPDISIEEHYELEYYITLDADYTSPAGSKTIKLTLICEQEEMYALYEIQDGKWIEKYNRTY